jgi:hypothetical protein
MSQLPLSPSAPANKQVVSFDLENLERTLARSTTFALCVIVGLPSVGVLFSLVIGLPFFAALMAGTFLFATGLTCRKALAMFTGRTLRLLVTARLVLLLVLAALLCCTTGSVWTAVVSAVLLWLIADRLLGRRALYDLWKLTRPRS